MVHQTHKSLPEPGDYRPASWRDAVGLLMALVGLALVGRHDSDDVMAVMCVDDGPMGQVRRGTSSRRRSVHGALAVKSAADARALTLLPTTRALN